LSSISVLKTDSTQKSFLSESLPLQDRNTYDCDCSYCFVHCI